MGQLSCFLSYANQYTKPFNEISSVVTELQNALACARRVFDFIEEQPEELDAASAIELKNPDGSMTLEHVSFSYNPEIKLLQERSVSAILEFRILQETVCGPTLEWFCRRPG